MNPTVPPSTQSSEVDNVERRSNMVDTKIPITWLITTCGCITAFLATTLWNVSMQTNKLDQLVASTTKIEANVAAQDGRMDKIRENAYMMQRTIDNQQLRIETLERSLRK